MSCNLNKTGYKNHLKKTASPALIPVFKYEQDGQTETVYKESAPVS